MINATTSDPYAYLDRALPNDPVAQYVPEERLDVNGNNVADEGGFGEDGFGFDDFLDIINPLQHIPGVSSLYREITGDEISPGARMVGGTIYGGGIGLAVSFVNSAIEDATGKDVGEHVISLFSTEEDAAPEEMIAATPSKSDDLIAAGAPKPIEPGPAATPPVIAAPLSAPSSAAPEVIPATETNDAMPSVTPIGLEWKESKPAILQQIEKTKTQDLTEEQLHAVFSSFRTTPSALTSPVTPADAKAASNAYQKTSAAAAVPQPSQIRADNSYERPFP